YQVGDDTHRFTGQLMRVIDSLGDKYQIDELVAKYAFTGIEGMTVPQALEIKEELEAIDELLKQLDEAAKTARIAVIDMEALERFASTEDMANLEELRRQVENLVREMAERQGLDRDERTGAFQLTPKAYKLFQGHLL